MLNGKANSRLSFRLSGVVVSVLLHCAVFSLVLSSRHRYVAPVMLPGDARGSQLTLTYLTGRAPRASTSGLPDARLPPAPIARTRLSNHAPPWPAVQSLAATDASRVPAPSSNKNNSPAWASPDSASGADSLGTGNINIAYLDSFRSPRPDLSSLPRGVSGDVILDVTIDTGGKIIAVKKSSGVGYGIDESVIASVQAWVFHPATKDGTPVVSEQELHFHYEHSRNG